jgi:hypothetical protein
VSQLLPSRMSATQCHQQFLECCRCERLDPEVKEQWMQLAEAWRFAAKRAEAFVSRGEIREAPEMNVQSNFLRRSRLVTNSLSCFENW